MDSPPEPPPLQGGRNGTRCWDGTHAVHGGGERAHERLRRWRAWLSPLLTGAGFFTPLARHSAGLDNSPHGFKEVVAKTVGDPLALLSIYRQPDN